MNESSPKELMILKGIKGSRVFFSNMLNDHDGLFDKLEFLDKTKFL